MENKEQELIRKIENRFNMNSFSWNKDKHSFMEFVLKELDKIK